MFGRSRSAKALGAGLAIGFVALIAFVGMNIWRVEKVSSLVEQSALQRTIRVAAVDLRDSLRIAESSQLGFLLTSNETYMARYDTAKPRARQYLEALSRMIAREAPNRAILSRFVAISA